MFVVALTEIQGGADAAASQLAGLLSKTEYELRVLFSGTLPRIAFRCSSREEASKVAAEVQRAGHGALVLSTADVAATPKITMRRFTFDGDALYERDRGGARLAWRDLAAVLVFSVRTDVLRTTTYMVAATATIRRNPDVKVERTHREHQLERFAHLVPKNAGATREPTWVLGEHDAKFLALGPKLRPTRRQNFDAMVQLVRHSAPHALLDDRFERSPLLRDHVLAVDGRESVDPSGVDLGVDVALFALARHLERAIASSSSHARSVF